MLKTYCRSCVYYRQPNGHGTYANCSHPENVEIKDTWLEAREDYKRQPDSINKENDCKWYKPVGF